MGFPGSPVGKESACNSEPSLISASGRSAGEGIGYPLQNSWASLVAQLVKNLPAMQETLVQRDRLPTPEFLGFPGGSAGKESICNEGDLGLIPGLGRSPGEGEGYPLQHSGLENSRDCVSPWGRKESDSVSDCHLLIYLLQYSWASLVAQLVKNLPAMQLTWV